jgi:hypothetical protein
MLYVPQNALDNVIAEYIATDMKVSELISELRYNLPTVEVKDTTKETTA